MVMGTHSIQIGNSTFFVYGADTFMLKEIAEQIGFKYDKMEPSKLSATQGIIRVWAIGELYDYLQTKN